MIRTATDTESARATATTTIRRCIHKPPNSATASTTTATDNATKPSFSFASSLHPTRRGLRRSTSPSATLVPSGRASARSSVSSVARLRGSAAMPSVSARLPPPASKARSAPDNCFDGRDNDCDDLLDHKDPDCVGPEVCDGFDNNNNGAIDELWLRQLGLPLRPSASACAAPRASWFARRTEAASNAAASRTRPASRGLRVPSSAVTDKTTTATA